MVTFHIPDMTCSHCASSITRAIAGVDPAARVEVSIPDKRVVVQSATGESALMDAIREAGYTPQPAQPATPRAAVSSGCCCASRKAAPVDAGQVPRPARSPCCS